MSKYEFMTQLKDRLSHLPVSEVEHALCYYDEYFSDAGTENEQQVLEDLGSPALIATKIIGEYAVNDAEAQQKQPLQTSAQTAKKKHTLLIVLLALFASPIALPIALSILAVVFSLVITAVALMISAIVVAVGGIVTVALSVMMMFADFSTALFFIGVGLVMFSVGGLLTIVSFKLLHVTVIRLQKLIGKILMKRGAK